MTEDVSLTRSRLGDTIKTRIIRFEDMVEEHIEMSCRRTIVVTEEAARDYFDQPQK